MISIKLKVCSEIMYIFYVQFTMIFFDFIGLNLCTCISELCHKTDTDFQPNILS